MLPSLQLGNVDADPWRPFQMNAKTAYYIKIILPQWFKHF